MGRLSAQLGRQAEDRAAAFLQAQGYEILQRNFRGGQGEIDIICRKGGVIYFVEVKYRGADSWVAPAEAVSADKRRRLYQAAQIWLKKHASMDCACSFLLLTISATGTMDLIEDFLHW